MHVSVLIRGRRKSFDLSLRQNLMSYMPIPLPSSQARHLKVTLPYFLGWECPSRHSVGYFGIGVVEINLLNFYVVSYAHICICCCFKEHTLFCVQAVIKLISKVKVMCPMCNEEEATVTIRPCGHQFCPG